jgi:DNA-directed RNA polymerase
MDADWLRQAQLDLENYALLRGRANTAAAMQRALNQRQIGHHAAGRKMVSDYLTLARDALEAGLAAEAEGRGFRTRAVEILRTLDLDVLAAISVSVPCTYVLRTVASNGSLPPTLTRVLDWGAKWVDDELCALCLKRNDPGLYKRLTAENKEDGLRAVRAAARGEGKRKLMEALKDRPEWTANLKGAVGEHLINAALATGLFQVTVHRDGKRLTNMVELTDEGMIVFLENEQLVLDLARPWFMPMVTQPGRWTDLKQGPYLTEELRVKFPLLFTQDAGVRKKFRDALNRGRLAKVVDALDVLQTTGFRFDETTLEAVEVAHREGWAIKKLPREIEASTLPANFAELDEVEQRRERVKHAELRELRHAMAVDSLSLRNRLETAHLLKGYPAVHLPHFVDFRGRVYPRPSLNHHAADYARGLFVFAKGEPLGDTGAEALSVHIANCASGSTGAKGVKLDKKPYDDRSDWVALNNGLIREIARNWQSKPELWIDADAPFALLTAAREFDAMMTWCEDGYSPESFLSRVPCGLDGTNNGIQNYSAIMRSREEGALVNLVTTEHPADIYAEAAHKVLAKVHADYGSDRTMTIKMRKAGEEKPVEVEVPVRHYAKLWLDFSLSRSIVKRPVMTFGYSAKKFGFCDQIMEDTMKPLRREVLMGTRDRHPFGEEDVKAAMYLAGHIWDAIGDMLPRTSSAMEWVTSVAGLLASHGQPLMWTTPTGIPIINRYQAYDSVRVKLFLKEAGVTRQAEPSFRTRGTGKLLAQEMRNASAPNLIHSMDASHLTLTVLACRDQGIHDLAMIHDSFATHAGKTQDLARILRETFVDMYENYCPLKEIDTQARRLLPVEVHGEIPELPAKGDLDLKEVLASPYFFC